MSVFAVTMVRDEADIVAETVGRMVQQVDRVIVADNGSTDGTREILEQLDVVILDDPEVGYFQSRKMSALADRARRLGADWVIPFDADEIWATEGRLADALRALPRHVAVAEAVLLDHVATAIDPTGPPVASMGWRRAQAVPLRKVACRAVDGLVIHQGNHGASIPGVHHPAAVTNLLEVRHFPYRSAEQMIRKARNGAAAYAATDLPEDAGAHWRGYGRIVAEQGEDALAGVFRQWFFSEDPQAEGLVYDPAPR